MGSTKPGNQKVKITKSTVDAFPIPESGQAFLRDTFLKGFGLRATASGSKAFIIEKRVNGKVKRKTLGRFGELTVEQARKMALQYLGKVAQGIDPQAESRQRRLHSTTLKQAYKQFLKARKNLKPRTLYDYERLMEVAFEDWAQKPLVEISKSMVAEKHRALGDKRGPAYANLSMRFLRSVLNFAMAHYDSENGHSILLENPVCVLTRTRAWYRLERRRTVLKSHQLPAWFQAVDTLRGPEKSYFSRTVGDYLIFLLFTGLRRQEAAKILWENVDFKDRSVLIQDPKNSIPLTLPLSGFLRDLLHSRFEERINEYVFPGKEGEGYLIEPKRQIAHVIKEFKADFVLHDLRRTFITVAESLNISPYTIKRLANHKLRDDVTAGYIISDIERLRKPMEEISQFLLDSSGPFKQNPTYSPSQPGPKPASRMQFFEQP
ncbi:tyrosine-type recombinase/integrase [Nitrospina gracilis]|uniref:tyrosine-type recombinase/integrase n=1 Tax=Nitrospina gracilis TaxID=35801 RepID=UPI001F3AA6ED|nr:integrase family protein [Nitrospina gracilis]MCF8719440.1 integrase [Nitrospina gracilis Nb-211]